VDVLVNIPIAKHHVGTLFSGNLKNMMGGLDHETNAFFHTGSGKGGLRGCGLPLTVHRRPEYAAKARPVRR